MTATGPYITRMTVAGGREIELEFHEPVYACDHSRVRGIWLIAFDEQDRILIIKRNDQWDIIRGQVEWDDDTYREAAQREAQEQASIDISTPVISTIIETKAVDKGQGSIILAVVARITAIHERPSGKPRGRRMLLLKDELFRRFQGRQREDMRRLIEMAEFALPKAKTSNMKIERHK